MAELGRWDVVVIGAGSVGTPVALSLAEAGARVLVLDGRPGAGQGSNKAAIGGVRATHSDLAKIRLGQRAVEIFTDWRERRGDDLEWQAGGYVFAAWRDEEAEALRRLLAVQQAAGLDVRWLDAPELLAVVPDLARPGLLGGAWSPRDGHCSPLLAMEAFRRHAERAGARFSFGERATGVERTGRRVTAVRTTLGRRPTARVVLASGAWARELAATWDEVLAVRPDAHEAGITEPVAPFLRPLVVDLRPGPGSANVYFFQQQTGQVVFCMTPAPLLWGGDTRETSRFLPSVAQRLLTAMPRLAALRVRRTWRGLYPMTPDGLPIVGWSQVLGGVFLAVGMCGQGFMFGPALGELVARAVLGRPTPADHAVLEALSPGRRTTQPERLG